MERQTSTQTINNQFYEELQDHWYTSFDHPVALLRAENSVRIPWVKEEIEKEFPQASVLDVGCGAGLLTNALASAGHKAAGIDLSGSSLETAKRYDKTGKVDYRLANAYSLPYPDHKFDVVCAMDVLEHVEDPSLVIAEASRVLKPNGLFFFHTFNRNLLSYLLIIKGVEWFVKNTPQNMHVYPLFIKPEELKKICRNFSLEVIKLRGFNPKINRSFFQMLFTRRVPAGFSFRFTRSLAVGYCGLAKKRIRGAYG